MKDNEGNIIVTKTRAIEFREHFNLPYRSYHIMCMIPQKQAGTYNWTKVTVITNNLNLERDVLLFNVLNKQKALPGMLNQPHSRITAPLPEGQWKLCRPGGHIMSQRDVYGIPLEA